MYVCMYVYDTVQREKKKKNKKQKKTKRKQKKERKRKKKGFRSGVQKPDYSPLGRGVWGEAQTTLEIDCIPYSNLIF